MTSCANANQSPAVVKLGEKNTQEKTNPNLREAQQVSCTAWNITAWNEQCSLKVFDWNGFCPWIRLRLCIFTRCLLARMSGIIFLGTCCSQWTTEHGFLFFAYFSVRTAPILIRRPLDCITGLLEIAIRTIRARVCGFDVYAQCETAKYSNAQICAGKKPRNQLSHYMLRSIS